LTLKVIKKSPKYIIGIDEVGRGPLAGRVFVGAVCLSEKNNNILKKNYQQKIDKLKVLNHLADSKKLTEKQRNEWFLWIKKNKVSYATSAISPKIIDKINISQASNKAAQIALGKLIKKNKIGLASIVTDAGIKIKTGFSFKSFPKADETVPVVSLASIVAKVTRDKEMVKFHKKHPLYGFDENKGYGTKNHICAIKKHGPSPIHRLTFIKKLNRIN